MPPGRRSSVRITSLVAVIALALALVACQGTSVQLPGTGPLLTVTMRGGNCPAATCEQSVILERDGRVHAAAKPPNDLGKVSAQAMAALTAAINQTDFAALKAHPFTGQCPTAFDGQELVFDFNVGAATQRIASCEVDIDWGSPLFVAIGAALGEWIPIPLT